MQKRQSGPPHPTDIQMGVRTTNEPSRAPCGPVLGNLPPTLLLHRMKRRSMSYHHPKLFLSGSTATSQGYHAAEPAAYREIHTGNELHPVLDSSTKLYCVCFPSFNHTSVETSGPIMRRLAGTLLQIRTCSPSVPSDCLECASQMFRAI